MESRKDYIEPSLLKVGQVIKCIVDGKEEQHKIAYLSSNNIEINFYRCGYHVRIIPFEDIKEIVSSGAQFVKRPTKIGLRCRDLQDNVQADQKTMLAQKSLQAFLDHGEISIGDKVGGQHTVDNCYLGTVTDIFLLESRNGPMKQYIVTRDDGHRHYLFEPEIYKIVV